MKPKPTSQEQRRARRKRADFTAEVIDAITRRPIGQLGDLSAGGLMLISQHTPRRDAIHQLRLPLSGLGGGTPRSIEVGVQAQWHKRAASPGQVWSGYRIIAISDADAASLNEWLALPT